VKNADAGSAPRSPYHKMDAILDSNSYLADIRMESIRFKNLFDYLRRTKSALVLPRLVREETVARYRHILEVQTKKTEQAVDALNRLIIDPDSRIHFNSPQTKYEIRDLRRKFRGPSKGVAVRYYPETEGIDIADVYLRGINRRRPANRDGEELRDVILWLLVLRYAGTEHKEVGFITSDNGFWDEESIHAQIREDIEKNKAKVHLFRTIEEFVRHSAPAPTPVVETEVSSFFDVMSISAQIADGVRKALAASRLAWGGRPISTQTAQLLQAMFSKGNVYQINEDTRLFELEYAVEVAAQTSSARTIYQPSVEPGVTVEPTAALRQARPFGSSEFIIEPMSAPYFFGAFGLNVPSGTTAVVRDVVTNYKVQGAAHISIRSEKGSLTEIELDGVDVSKVKTA
jgi:hypothetical protein